MIMIGVNGLSQIAEKEEGWVEYGDDQNKVQLKIAKVATEMPDGFYLNSDIYGIVPTLRIFVNYDTLNNIENELLETSNIKESIKLDVYSTNREKLDEQLEIINLKYNTNLSSIYIDTSDKIMEKQITQVFLTSISILIIIITVVNLINVVVCDINLRMKDFSVLISIGISKKDMNKIILTEYLVYLIIPYIAGIALSLLTSYILFKTIDYYEYFNFNIPYIEIIILLTVILIAITSIIKYVNKKINNSEIIEIIKKNNI